jgi:hypothetical protein
MLISLFCKMGTEMIPRLGDSSDGVAQVSLSSKPSQEALMHLKKAA